MKRQFSLMIFVGMLWSIPALSAVVLWPDAACAPAAINGGKISIADGRIRCGGECAQMDKGPGVSLTIPDSRQRMDGFGRVDAAVSNLTGRTTEICLSVKGGGVRRRWIRLGPHEKGTIRVPIRTPELYDLPFKLNGLQRQPECTMDFRRFDASRVTEVSIFNNKPVGPCEFAVEGIVATGEAAGTKIVKVGDIFPLVDEYGQLRMLDWPGKVKSDADLVRARESEAAWLDANANAFSDRDMWGGWAKGPQLKATGAFRTEKVGGKWWLVDPDGRLFWSHGITCVAERSHGTKVGGRENYFAPYRSVMNGPFKDCEFFLPGASGAVLAYNFFRANIRRKYIEEWGGVWRYGELAHRRLHAWGINTLGDWSDPDICLQRKTPYTIDCSPWLRKLEGGKIHVPDPFDAEFERRIENAVLELRRSGIADDPWCIGFFVNNEIEWGDDDVSVARAVVRSASGQPAKREMTEGLRGKYGEIAILNEAWGTSYASWDEFMNATVVPDSASARNDLMAFERLFAQRYFSTVADIIHRLAPGRLYLGSRFAQGGATAYRAAATSCDIVTSNIYMPLPVPRHGAEPDFPDCPTLVGEFHFHALNTGHFTVGVGVTAKERKLYYEEYVRHALADPQCVGTHWFQWSDQPVTGRPDGENFSCGFVDICDRPHRDLVAAARKVAAEMYPLRYQGAEKE